MGPTIYEPTSHKKHTIHLCVYSWAINHSVFFQERGDVFYLSLGTIDNCLRYPDVIPIVKQMDIVPHVATFLDKRSPKHSKD